MAEAAAGGARRELTGDAPGPPTGMSWSGSLLPGSEPSARPEPITQPVPRVREDDAPPAPGTEPDEPGTATRGLAELLAAEDVGRAGPAVLGADPAPGSSGDAGEWPTLHRRERKPAQPRGAAALDWIRRRRAR
ncbi:hypothetical protein ACL03H_16685 [Saccharopolyspora sp. MS10]|uniref:hypothetical protein n=1 Tax=Saccharopolyspora sp. MS10 TaxID=3385973 RepID=UPI0039A19E9C